jgi:hypothetical protein
LGEVFGLEVSDGAEDHAVGLDEAAVVVDEVVAGQQGEAVRVSAGVEGVGVVAEEGALHDAARDAAR